MTLKSQISAFALMASMAVAGVTAGSAMAQSDMEKATRIAKENIIIDTHIDVPFRLKGTLDRTGQWIDVGVSTGDEGDFDYPRAKAGGLDAPFMSIYIPASYEPNGQPNGSASKLADELIDLMERVVSEHPDKFAIPHSVDDMIKHFEEGKISLPLGMENGAPIEGKMENLEHFYKRGIRYITLTHSAWNHISDSSYDADKHWGGLSPFGKDLVVEMNKTGVMVDISHVSDQAFWDVMEITKTPVIASHSSARHYTPGFERNMNDDMIKALAENGGVIQINYGSSFLTEEANTYRARGAADYQAHLEANGLEDSREVRTAFMETWTAANPYPFATFDETLDHFDHVVKLVGIDHVGIGSDYDGVGNTLPIGLKDASSFPSLVKGLLDRGYSEEDIKKVLGGNLIRVWRAVEAYAAAN